MCVEEEESCCKSTPPCSFLGERKQIYRDKSRETYKEPHHQQQNIHYIYGSLDRLNRQSPERRHGILAGMKKPGISHGKHGAKKILIVTYYYVPYVFSGLSNCVRYVAEGLVKEGHEVTVITSRYEKNLPKQEVINGVRILRRPVLFKLNKGVIMPTFWWDVVWHSRKHDYVNPHLPLADVGLSSLFIPKHKMVTTYQCDINLGDKPLDKMITKVSLWLMKIQLSRSRVVVASTLDYLEHSKMKKYLYKATPICPTISLASLGHVNPEPLFRRLGIQNNEVKVGFVGRIVYEKGIRYLLEAISHLEKELKNFRIIITGEYENVAGGSIKDELDSFLLKYPGRILFTGYLSDEDRQRFYSGIDVLVLPSIDPLEAFGMVQVEAMLCGAPVIASDLPGVRQIVQQTGYGRISKQKDPKSIADAILEVVQHRATYKPDITKVRQRFDPAMTIKMYEDCFSDAHGA